MKNITAKIFPLIVLLSLLLSACAVENSTTQEPASTVDGNSLQASAAPQESQAQKPITQQDTADQSAALSLPENTQTDSLSYAIVDSGQGKCYDDTAAVNCPSAGSEFYGQDAQYAGNQPRYQDNGDGTVTDLVSGLMWQQDPGEKVTFEQAVAGAGDLTLAGYDDWRLPTIKELYSLILFDGTDVSGPGMTYAVPFVDLDYFVFQYGNADEGERTIDSQFWSATEYVSTTMGGMATTFGVNFADGRIKGYGRGTPGGREMTQYVRYVRANPEYGINDFEDNGNGTISDNATGLLWMQDDSGSGMDWSEALGYCETLDYAGRDDWRLPNAKELQSIVDYSRSPDTTGSAAIDPLFNVSEITNELGQLDYPFYWSSTTHAVGSGRGTSAAYVAFGRAMGNLNGSGWVDVHGAGAQRSDPKSGDPSQWAEGHGPQGDSVHIDNYVRCVSGGSAESDPDGSPENRSGVEIESTGAMNNQNMPGQGQQPPNGAQPPSNGQRPPSGDGNRPQPPARPDGSEQLFLEGTSLSA